MFLVNVGLVTATQLTFSNDRVEESLIGLFLLLKGAVKPIDAISGPEERN